MAIMIETLQQFYRLPLVGTTLRQFKNYSMVGVINTIVGYGTIFIAMSFGLSPYYSNILGYALGLCCSYLLNRFWVFRREATPGHFAKQGLRFLGSFAVAYGVNFLILHLALQMEMGKYLSQIIASVSYVLVMFLITKFWVFREAGHHESA